MWARWIPEIVIELVSPSSVHRDYVEKPEEYPAFGVLEYWIFDADRMEALILRRSRGRWVKMVVRPPDFYSTHLLPDFKLDVPTVFAAADVTGPR